MTKKNSKILQRLRIGAQILFTFLFFYLLIHAGRSGTSSFKFTETFFYFDPLHLILNFISTHKIIGIFLLSLIPLVLTLFLGRFFCGWICPMGAIHQFFTWIFHKHRKKKKEWHSVHKPLLKLKYVILILVVTFAIMGTQVGGWLDPFSLLTRSSATVINPAANYAINHTLKAGANDTGLVAKTIKPAYRFARNNVLKNKQRYHTQTLIIGLLFFAFIMLNLYRRRFFCNHLCPLGALYGLISKFSIFNLKTNSKCVSCELCAKNCTYNGSPFKDYMKSECVVCFNCTSDCPHDAIDVKFLPPKKENVTQISLGRRKVIGSLTSGIFLGTLPNIAKAAKKKAHPFCRPPGSVAEKDFLAKCIRCGECMQVCPTNFLQPALFQTGVGGIWTPILDPYTGYCEFECNKCTQVCPTKAIEPLTIKEKKEFKIGTAVIDRNRCYTYADGYNCAVCEEHCPVPDKAIRFREVDVWNFEGKLVKVKQIYVIPDLCTGCGICENVCPRIDKPGILLSAEEEQREASY